MIVVALRVLDAATVVVVVAVVVAVVAVAMSVPDVVVVAVPILNVCATNEGLSSGGSHKIVIGGRHQRHPSLRGNWSSSAH